MLFFKRKDKFIKQKEAIAFFLNQKKMLDELQSEPSWDLYSEIKPKWDELKLLNRIDGNILNWIKETSPFVENYFGRGSSEFVMYRFIRYRAPQLSDREYTLGFQCWRIGMIGILEKLISKIESEIR